MELADSGPLNTKWAMPKTTLTPKSPLLSTTEEVQSFFDEVFNKDHHMSRSTVSEFFTIFQIIFFNLFILSL